MSHGDASHESVDERDERGHQSDSRSAGGTVGKLSGYLRTGARSGALAGIGGAATMVRGLRAIRAGDRARGVNQLAVGAGLLALSAVQRRSRRDPGERIDIDQSDVVDTGPDLESAATESGGQPDHAGGEEASSIVDTGPDIEDAVEEREETSDRTGDESSASAGEAAEESPVSTGDRTTDDSAESTGDQTTGESTESSGDTAPLADDRLGETAFDADSNEVPAPQRAFNQEFLSMNAEAVWGIRDDDAVVVSQLYDPIEGGDDVRYVASTQVTEDRLVVIPDEVLDHWERVADGVRIAGGDDVVFATSGELQEDEQLVVVPAALADDVVSDDA